LIFVVVEFLHFEKLKSGAKSSFGAADREKTRKNKVISRSSIPFQTVFYQRSQPTKKLGNTISRSISNIPAGPYR
jgi:hypothetical protein